MGLPLLPHALPTNQPSSLRLASAQCVRSTTPDSLTSFKNRSGLPLVPSLTLCRGCTAHCYTRSLRNDGVPPCSRVLPNDGPSPDSTVRCHIHGAGRAFSCCSV